MNEQEFANSNEGDDDLGLHDVEEEKDDDILLETKDPQTTEANSSHSNLQDYALMLDEEELSNVMTFDQVELPHAQEDDQIFMVKLPSSISIDSRPFDRHIYRSMRSKNSNREVENVIRWKNAEKTKKSVGRERESNAKLVEWEDGSINLFIGNKLVYQIEKKPLPKGLSDLFCLPSSGVAICEGQLEQKLLIRKLGSTVIKSSEKKARRLQLQETIEDPEFQKRQREKEYLENKKKSKSRSRPVKSRKREESPLREPDEEDLYEDEIQSSSYSAKKRMIDDEQIYKSKSNPSQVSVAYKKRKALQEEDEDEEYDEKEEDEEKEEEDNDLELYDSDENSPKQKNEKSKDALVIDDDD